MISVMKKELTTQESVLYLLAFFWHLLLFSSWILPYAYEIILSEELSFIIINNLLDLIAIILLFFLIINLKTQIIKKKIMQILFALLISGLPIFFLYLSLSDFLRFSN